MSVYRGVGGVNRKVTSWYRGVGGVNRLLSTVYRGVSNVNRVVHAITQKLLYKDGVTYESRTTLPYVRQDETGTAKAYTEDATGILLSPAGAKTSCGFYVNYQIPVGTYKTAYAEFTVDTTLPQDTEVVVVISRNMLNVYNSYWGDKYLMEGAAAGRYRFDLNLNSVTYDIYLAVYIYKGASAPATPVTVTVHEVGLT